MLFTKKRQSHPDIKLHIQNEEILRVQSATFLGFTLDPKLSGKEHLKTLVNKGRNLTNILAVLAGTKWGSHPSLLLTLYRAVFRSGIEYGCQVFKLKGNKTEFLTGKSTEICILLSDTDYLHLSASLWPKQRKSLLTSDLAI